MSKNCSFTEYGIVYCGGIMTSSGYSEPRKENFEIDNPDLSEVLSGNCESLSGYVCNNTNADAFVYTYCNSEDPEYCNGVTPDSVLYVFKSSCSPHMKCEYKDDPENPNIKIISDNSKIWAKKITGSMHEVHLNNGAFDYEHLDKLAKEAVKNTKSAKVSKIVSFANQEDDLSGFVTTIIDGERKNSFYNIVSGIVYSNTDIKEKVSGITINNRPISSGDCICEVVSGNSTISAITANFDKYSSGMTNDNKRELTNNIYNAVSNVELNSITLKLFPNITQSEYDGYVENINDKRIELIEKFTDRSESFETGYKNSFSGDPKVVIYTDRTVITDYDKESGNTPTRITNYESGNPYSDFAVGAQKVEFSFINDEDSKWGADLFADVPISSNTGMFSGCTSLISCDIPCQMRYISPYTFSGCSSLSSYTTNPDHIDAIDKFAFKDSGLKTAVIGRHTVLRESAFTDAHELVEVKWYNYTPSAETRSRLYSGDTFPGSDYWKVTDTDTVNNSVSGAAFPKAAFKNCEKLSGITIPSGITIIGEEAFMNCSGLETVKLTSVERIHQKAFYLCGKTTKFEGLNNVKYFGRDAIVKAGANDKTIIIDGLENAETILSYAFSGKTISSDTSNKNIVILNKIGSIGNYAFYNSTINGGLNISGHTASSVLIGEDAFYGVSALTNGSMSGITIMPKNDESVIAPTNLSGKTFANSVVNRGGLHIYNCIMLSACTFADSKISGDSSVISGCQLSASSFSGTTFDGSLSIIEDGKNIPTTAFYSGKVTSDCSISADSISGSAFADFTVGKNLNVNVTNTIGNSAFTNVTVNEKLSIVAKEFGDYSFYGTKAKDCDIIGSHSNTKLGKSAFAKFNVGGNLSVNVNEIGDYAFNDADETDANRMSCSGLTVNANTIGENAFVKAEISGDCSISAGSIGNRAFENTKINGYLEIIGAYSIGNYAFENANAYGAKLELTDNCIIGDYAFNGSEFHETLINNESLVNPTIGNYAFSSFIFYDSSIDIDTNGDGAQSTIGEYAFSNTNLTSVTFNFNDITDYSILSIGNYAFNECSGLTQVYVKTENPPYLGYGVFDECHDDLTIYVPSGSKNTYDTAPNWSTYAPKIQETSLT